MPPTTSPKPSSQSATPASVKRDAKAMLTSMKDVERNIARYVSPLDVEGMRLAGMQLAMLRRQLTDVAAGVEALLKG